MPAFQKIATFFALGLAASSVLAVPVYDATTDAVAVDARSEEIFAQLFSREVQDIDLAYMTGAQLVGYAEAHPEFSIPDIFNKIKKAVTSSPVLSTIANVAKTVGGAVLPAIIQGGGNPITTATGILSNLAGAAVNALGGGSASGTTSSGASGVAGAVGSVANALLGST